MSMRSHITFIALVAMLFSIAQPATTFAAATALTSVSSCPLTMNTPYKTPNNSAVYYVSHDCRLTLIESERKYFTYFQSWDRVLIVDQSSLIAVPASTLGYLPWGPYTQLQNGELFKFAGANPAVYLYMNGQAHKIASEQAFTQYGYQWEWVRDMDTSYASMTKYLNPQTGRVGRTISDTRWLPLGILVRPEGSNDVYMLETNGGNKSWGWIPSMEVLRSTGFDESRILVVTASVWAGLQAAWPDEYWCTELSSPSQPTRRSVATIPWYQSYLSPGYSTATYQTPDPEDCQSDPPIQLID